MFMIYRSMLTSVQERRRRYFEHERIREQARRQEEERKRLQDEASTAALLAAERKWMEGAQPQLSQRLDEIIADCRRRAEDHARDHARVQHPVRQWLATTSSPPKPTRKPSTFLPAGHRTATHGPFGILPEVLMRRCGDDEYAQLIEDEREYKAAPFRFAKPFPYDRFRRHETNDVLAFRSEPAAVVPTQPSPVPIPDVKPSSPLSAVEGTVVAAHDYDADDKTFAEWDRRFESARKQQRERETDDDDDEPEIEHSTGGILARVKTWAGNAWAWVKERIVGAWV
jgi:hypothetical protein